MKRTTITFLGLESLSARILSVGAVGHETFSHGLLEIGGCAFTLDVQTVYGVRRV